MVGLEDGSVILENQGVRKKKKSKDEKFFKK